MIVPTTFEAMKALLDEKAARYNHPDFIESDPIQLPKRFTRKEDIEITAFLVATIAWGNRKSIITSGEKLLEIMDHQPFEFVQNYSERTLKFVHRTFNSEDLNAFFEKLRLCYLQGGLESYFSLSDSNGTIKDRITGFRSKFTAPPFPSRTEKHLSNPEKGSAAKRINMFLRWMVRSDSNGVDFGIWKSISPAELHLPLDVHTGNVARKLGLITRKQNDWLALSELQEHLIQFDPEDPGKYDFALFGLGAFENIK
jgi:uncharacterized protein (TIGR02757 family)